MPWNPQDDWRKNDNIPLDAYRLMQVYEATKSSDPAVLKRAAKEMFPDRFGDAEPEIWVHQSSGRNYCHNGEWRRAAFSIMTYKCNEIGVMDDGTAYIS